MYLNVKFIALVDFFAVHRKFYNKNPLTTIQGISFKYFFLIPSLFQGQKVVRNLIKFINEEF